MPMNVDQEEVAKFDDHANDWWQPDGAMKALHDINPLRLDFIQQQVNLSNKKIIDVGCGGGILTEAMTKAGADVTGIDMSEPSLNAAINHAKEKKLKINYIHSTSNDIAEEQQQEFDIVTCMELLEHVPDPAQIVRDCANLVKPNGHVFFSTINRNPLSYLQAIIGAEYILQLVPKRTHDFEKFIRPSELASMAEEAGLRIQHMTGMSYNPLTKQYFLTQSVKVNYLIHCKKID